MAWGADLLQHGYDVLNLDIVPPADRQTPFCRVDLTNYGKTFAAMNGYDAVVHLAADPRPDIDHVTNAQRFTNNLFSSFNVFQAAALGMARVVWASSDTIFSNPLKNVQQNSMPIAEDTPLKPQTGYALAKVAAEELEPFRPIFVEDPQRAENSDSYTRLRTQTAVPHPAR